MNKDPLKRWYIAHGICIGCRKENAMQGRQKCPDCLYKQTLQNMKYRSLEKERKRYAKRKKQREQRIASGMCPNCGNPAAHGQLCRDCYIRQKRRREKEKQQRNIEHPFHTRMNAGLCVWCDTPAMPGRKVCEIHYAALLNREGFGKKRGENHPWAKDETARLKQLRERSSKNFERG